MCVLVLFFLLMRRRPTRSTLTDTRFPDTTLFRSGLVYQNGDINSSSFALGVRRLGFAPAAARHRGPTRCAPQARKRSWPKVTTHMAGARSQADLASQGDRKSTRLNSSH